MKQENIGLRGQCRCKKALNGMKQENIGLRGLENVVWWYFDSAETFLGTCIPTQVGDPAPREKI